MSAQNEVIVTVLLGFRPVVPDVCVPVFKRMSAEEDMLDELSAAERVVQGLALEPQLEEDGAVCSI